MTVGVIVAQALIEPDHVIDPERPAQPRGDRLGIEVRVAATAEQTLLGGQQRAGAVDLDRAALEHEIERGAVRARPLHHALGDLAIAGHHVLATPAVEAKARR